MKFYVIIRQYKCTLHYQVLLKHIWNLQIYIQFWSRQLPFYSTHDTRHARSLTARELQPKSKTTEKLKVSLRTIWEELLQEHINEVVVNFTKHLTASVAANGGHWASAVTLSVCISSPTNCGSFRLWGKTTLRTLRNGNVLRLHIPDTLLEIWSTDDRVYV